MEQTDPPSEPEIGVQVAQDMGIPAEVVLLEENANTTREESIRLRKTLVLRNTGRILLVTESLHMRRAKWVFRMCWVSSTADTV